MAVNSSTESPKPSEIDKPKPIYADPHIQLCTSTGVTVTDDVFILQITSGAIVDGQYAYTPLHMKRLLKILISQVDAYEKKHGEIKIPDDQSSK